MGDAAMHALIIEDDALLAMMIEDELRELGFTSVVTASTEEEAVSSIAMRCPDLVTSDGSLLAGSGMGAVRTICASCFVPEIFITADPERARRCVPGAVVIDKPFFAAQLIDAVSALVGRRYGKLRMISAPLDV